MPYPAITTHLYYYTIIRQNQSYLTKTAPNQQYRIMSAYNNLYRQQNCTSQHCLPIHPASPLPTPHNNPPRRITGFPPIAIRASTPPPLYSGTRSRRTWRPFAPGAGGSISLSLSLARDTVRERKVVRKPQSRRRRRDTSRRGKDAAADGLFASSMQSFGVCIYSERRGKEVRLFSGSLVMDCE